MPRRDIIVIGASHGGTEPIGQIVRGLSPDLQASIFIVRHIPPGGYDYLVNILARNTTLSVISAGHCEDIQKGTIYIAPADHHLLINSTQTYLSPGPRENLCRPAIDPLFRSAAVAFGPRVIGIVLSGQLDDGTPGLAIIKKCGGMAIIQDPATAIAPSMPESAALDVAVDYTLPAIEIGKLLNVLVQEEVPPDFHCPEEARKELVFLTGTRDGIEEMADNGKLVPMGCPACGGPLWEMNGELTRYRCHIGHAFTGRTVIQGLKDVEEQALFAALRSMEERVKMLKKLNKESPVHIYEERLREAEAHTQQLRDLLRLSKGQMWKC